MAAAGTPAEHAASSTLADKPHDADASAEPVRVHPDAVPVAAPGALAEGIVRQDEVPLTDFPNGMRRTVRMVYDVSHGQHHPLQLLHTGDVQKSGVETPHAVNLAYAYMASAGALNDLVTVRAPPPAPEVASSQPQYDESAALRYVHACGLLGTRGAQSPCGAGVGYPTPHSVQCSVDVCNSVDHAVRAVVSGTTDGALALTRPVGSSIPPPEDGTSAKLQAVVREAQPSAYATCNAVRHAVQSAWDAGAQRVGIVSLQTWYPLGLAQFVRDAPSGSAFLASVHASAKTGTVSRDADYGPSKDSADGVLNVQLFARGSGADAVVHAARKVLLPAMTAYNPDVLVVVCGEQNTLPTYPIDVRCETAPTTWAVVVQELMAACPGVVVLTDALLRPNKCAAALTHVMYALQGRAFQYNLGDTSTSIRANIVGKTDVDHAAAAYVHATAADGPYAAVKAALQPHAGTGAGDAKP